MYRSPSRLSDTARSAVADTLNARLADGLDLHGQIKVAHWNIKGPHFAALHPLFETFAVSLADHNDSFAERAVALGGRAYGSARHVAKTSRLPEYPRSSGEIAGGLHDLGENESRRDVQVRDAHRRAIHPVLARRK